jgi:hypothetical protein
MNMQKIHKCNRLLDLPDVVRRALNRGAVKPPLKGERDKQMKDSTKARILAAGLGVAVMLTPAACDNGTTSETARDVKIAEHGGKAIYVNCLPSQDDAKEKIAAAVEDILDDSDGDATAFKSIVASLGLRIIIIINGVFVPGYIYDGSDGVLKFYYRYILEGTNDNIKNDILHGVNDRMTAMLFNNAENPVRVAFAGSARTRRA